MWERVQGILFGSVAQTVGTIVLAVGAAHVVYFLVVPWLLAHRKTHCPPVRRILERVVATPSLFGDFVRLDARYHLMRLSLMEALHEQVVAQGQAILRNPPLLPNFVAEVRGLMAHALEGLGRGDDADEQRRLATESLKEVKRDAAWYLTRGRQLTTREDHAGACRAFEQGLDVAPPGPNETRAMLTIGLAVQLFMAGRTEDSALRAEEALGLVRDPERLTLLHRQAAASYSSLGRLEEAAGHTRKLIEMAERTGDTKTLSDALGNLAGEQRKRGRLVEALASCDEAVARTRPTRHLALIRFEILRSWGRFEEALADSRRAGELDRLAVPHAERQSQGILAYGRVLPLTELGRLDEAEACLEAARSNLRGSAKLTLWCDASAVRLAALRGRRDEAIRELDRVDTRLIDFAQDRNTRSTVLASLGRATLALAEHGRGIGLWERYLNLPPTPVDVPTALYHLAEAHRGLGDNNAARARYREAIATGLDTHYVHLAESRLRTLPI